MVTSIARLRSAHTATQISAESIISPRYRLEHQHPPVAPTIVLFADTLASALVELAIVRQWLRAAHAEGRLVVIDQHGSPEQRIGSYPIAYRTPDHLNGPRRESD